MKYILAPSLFLALSCNAVLADVYKCVSSSGKASFSEKKCAGGFVKDGKRWLSVGSDEHLLLKESRKAAVIPTKFQKAPVTDFTLFDVVN